ncbi:hypothetical protein Tco_0985147, partial [Tanacetum coccineum]
FNTTAGNPVKKILLKLNLSDHRIFKDGGGGLRGTSEMLSSKGFKDGVFDGGFGGVGDEEVVVREGVVVISSSLEMLTNSCLGGIMVSLIFWEELEEET